MPFTEDQRREISEALNERIKAIPECPISGDNEWAISDEMGAMSASDLPMIKMTNKYFPLLLVSCKTCGYSMMFNAKALGLDSLLEQIPEPEVE